MTHYEQCCARECPDGCGLGLSIQDGTHYRNGKEFDCTAPSIEKFAERCAEALEALANEASGFLAVAGNDPWQGARSRLIEAVGLTNIRCLERKIEAARRALGLEK